MKVTKPKSLQAKEEFIGQIMQWTKDPRFTIWEFRIEYKSTSKIIIADYTLDLPKSAYKVDLSEKGTYFVSASLRREYESPFQEYSKHYHLFSREADDLLNKAYKTIATILDTYEFEKTFCSLRPTINHE